MRWFVFGCVSAVLLVACGKKPAGPEAAQPIEVSIVTVTRQDAPVSYEFVGQTQSSAQVQIVARVAGFLDEQVYTEGSMVKAGRDHVPAGSEAVSGAARCGEGRARRAAGALAGRRDNLARVQPLVALNALAQKDLDDATGAEQAAGAAVEIAKANVEQAQLNLGYTTIRSPVAGRLELRARQRRFVPRPAEQPAHLRVAAGSDVRELQHLRKRNAAA